MNVSRTAYQYEPKLADDQEIKNELTTLAEKHRRYGFTKMFNKIRQCGHVWNHKRVYRVYCDMKLNLRRKPKKRLPKREKIALAQPNRMNVSWSMDFMSDAFMTGKKFRTLNIIDDCNREVLGISKRITAIKACY